MVPNKKHGEKSLPPEDLQVSQRLRSIREQLRLTQSEFAAQVGITRVRLASYEEGRNSVRFDVALRICRQFIFSEKWLATGEGDPRIVMDLTGDAVILRVPADFSYARAWPLYIAKRYDEIFERMSGELRIEIKEGDDLGFINNLFEMLLHRWQGMVGPEDFPRLLSNLILVGVDMVALRLREKTLPVLNRIETDDGIFYGPEDGLLKKSSNIPLTDVPDSGNSEAVQTEMDKLLNRLRKATRERGKMAALAKYLNVKLAAVSEWLSDKSPREPGGEYALRILTWVESEERQQKSSSGVSALLEPKTRKSKSSYEKPKSSPTKR